MKKYFLMVQFCLVLFSILLLTSCEERNQENLNRDTVQSNIDTTSETETITLIVPDNEFLLFTSVTGFYDGTAEKMIALLKDAKAVPKGTKLNSFRIEENIAIIDLSDDFEKGLISETGEEMYLGALVDTVITNYSVEKVTVLIDGRALKTENELYDHPIEYISVAKLYLPNLNNKDMIENAYASFDGTLNGLVDKLVLQGALPEGTKVLSYSMSNDIIKIDFSTELEKIAEDPETEKIKTASLVNTVIDYYKCEKVLLTVDGKPFETENRSYDEALGFVDYYNYAD